MLIIDELAKLFCSLLRLPVAVKVIVLTLSASSASFSNFSQRNLGRSVSRKIAL